MVVIAGPILGSHGRCGTEWRGCVVLAQSHGSGRGKCAGANPSLELRDANGAFLAANNDWQDNPAHGAELTAAGLAPMKHP